jgi:hypothetical protein
MQRWRFRKKAARKKISRDVMRKAPAVNVHDKTEEIAPLNLVPGLECETTEIGIAEVGDKKTVYIRMRLKKEI